MDRVFSSMEEMSGHLWSSSSAAAAAPANENEEEDEQSKMNRSASEWAFQRFLQEASVSPSSSSPAPEQNDVEEIKVIAAYPNGPNPTRTNNNSSSNSSNTASFNLQLQPPNVPVDSEEYQAFLKTKLDLACAAVALSRVKVRSFLSGPLEICSNSNGMV